jgi:hypothetical protein
LTSTCRPNHLNSLSLFLVIISFLNYLFLHSLLKAPIQLFYDLILCFLLNRYSIIFYNSLLFINHCRVHTVKFFTYNLIGKWNGYPTKKKKAEQEPHLLSPSLQSLHFFQISLTSLRSKPLPVSPVYLKHPYPLLATTRIPQVQFHNFFS